MATTGADRGNIFARCGRLPVAAVAPTQDIGIAERVGRAARETIADIDGGEPQAEAFAQLAGPIVAPAQWCSTLTHSAAVVTAGAEGDERLPCRNCRLTAAVVAPALRCAIGHQPASVVHAGGETCEGSGGRHRLPVGI